ncbi:hypothetical protein ACFQAT_16090 [Undibacterium arcticum]|uniref:Uncharacterized protein n=1 Tax=Undibacterium arcticum TaxID=1762892 RepID=A0ABV7EVL5_9BURK
MISFNIDVLLADPRSATLVTGVKRDIQLLRSIDAASGSGRKLAAGVNHLAAADVAHFIASFETCCGTR